MEELVSMPDEASFKSLELDEDRDTTIDNVSKLVARFEVDNSSGYNFYKDLKKCHNLFPVPICRLMNPDVKGMASLDKASKLFEAYNKCLIITKIQFVLRYTKKESSKGEQV